MFVFLDARDIISIFERSQPLTGTEFEAVVRGRGHLLVLTMSVVFEVAAPLGFRNSRTNVMALLNRLERVPHTFINEARIGPMEYEEAIRAFSAGEPRCRPIDPFVRRFDEAVDMHARPATRIFVAHGLAETVFTLWTEDRRCFEGYRRHGEELRRLITADRELTPVPDLRNSFATTVSRQLRTYGLTAPLAGATALAGWIYDVPQRCPSETLMYHLHHAIRANVGDQVEASTLADLLHTRSLPYVDVMTLDRRMTDYVGRASPAVGVDYPLRTFSSVDTLLEYLSRGASGGGPA